jgi:hypothetical protein
MQWSKGGPAVPHKNGSGPPRPQFGWRLLIVAATWSVLAAVALMVHPAIALTAGLLPLALAGRAAWRARAAGRWQSADHQLQRSVTASAILTAGGLFAGTYWSLRDRVPYWGLALELMLLAHYWLLTLAH